MNEEEYTISDGNKIFYGILAFAMFLFSIFLFNIKSPSVTPFVIIIPLLLITGSILIVINLVKRKVVLSEDSILCVNLFSTKELNVSLIKGYRLGSKFIKIEPILSTDPIITIGNYFDFKDSDKIVSWVKSRFKDLDAIDLENEQQSLLQDIELGKSEGERTEKLKQAKDTYISYSIIGSVGGFFLIFFDNTFSVIFLLIYPLIGIVILYINGLIKFLSNSKRSIYGHIIIGFALPCFILLIKSLGSYSLFQLDNLWLPSIIISSSIFLLLYIKGINKSIDSIKSQVFVMLIVSFLYGFGSTRTINCYFDKSKEQIFYATALNHRISHGKSTSYYLTLSSWGPQSLEKEVEVHRSLYENTVIGDTVKIIYKDGLFHIPWFVVKKNN